MIPEGGITVDGWHFPAGAAPYLATTHDGGGGPGVDFVGIQELGSTVIRVPRRYIDRVEREYEVLKDWLPTKLNTVLDIGCGLAGVDVLLARKAGAKVFHLVDGHGEPKTARGFTPAMTAWTDVAVSAAVLKANADCEVHTYHPDATLTIPAVDLIYSGASWGHHYPIAIYGALAQRVLNAGGRIILDVRRGTAGVADLAVLGFRCLGPVNDSMRKRTRFAFERS